MAVGDFLNLIFMAADLAGIALLNETVGPSTTVAPVDPRFLPKLDDIGKIVDKLDGEASKSHSEVATTFDPEEYLARSKLEYVMEETAIDVEYAINKTLALPHTSIPSRRDHTRPLLIFLFVASLMIAITGMVYGGYYHVNWEHALVLLKIRKADDDNFQIRMSDLSARDLNDV